jgi:hypothetical protein
MEVTIIIFSMNSKKRVKEVLQRMNNIQGKIKFHFTISPNGASVNSTENIEIDDAFKIIETLRGQRKYNHHLIGIFDKPFVNNWFSITQHKLKDSIITTAGWEILSHLNIESYLVLEIAANLLEQIMELEDYEFTHEPPIGCISDMCTYKTDINLKILTGYICPICSERIEKKINKKDFNAFKELFNLAREYAFYRVKPEKEIESDILIFPVSVYLRKLKSEPDIREKFSLLLDLFDVSIRTAVIILNARLSELINEYQLTNGMNNPSLGDWVLKFHEALNILKSNDDKFFNKYFKSLEEAYKILCDKNLVNVRNETKGHAYTLPKEELSNYFQNNQQHIIRIVKILESFFSLTLAKVTSLRYDRTRGNLLLCHCLNGSNPIFERIEMPITPQSNKIDILNTEDEIILFNDDKTDYISLYPYLVHKTCPTCGQPRMLIIDYEDKYLDLQIGHRVRIDCC